MDEDFPRFSAALQDKKDPNKYQDFLNTDDESLARKEADLSAKTNQLCAIVFDRKYGIIYRVEKDLPGKEQGDWLRDESPEKRGRPKKAVVEEPPKKKRGRPKKIVDDTPKKVIPPHPKERIPNSAYFD